MPTISMAALGPTSQDVLGPAPTEPSPYRSAPSAALHVENQPPQPEREA